MSIETSSSLLDVRDLAEIATAAVNTLQEFADDLADEDEADEAREDLGMLRAFLSELGYSVENDGVVDALESIENNEGVTLVNDSYLEEYVEEYLKDCGYIPADLPSFIENHINWAGITEDWKHDHSSADLDGVTFWTS